MLASNACTSVCGGTPGIVDNSEFGLPSSNAKSPVLAPAAPAKPPTPIGNPASSPVVEKQEPERISSVLTSLNLSYRRIKLPVEKLDCKTDGPKVPFFEDEKWLSKYKADIIVKEECTLEEEKANDTKASAENGHDGLPTEKGNCYITLTAHGPKIESPDKKMEEFPAKGRVEPGFYCRVKDFLFGRPDCGSFKLFGNRDLRRFNIVIAIVILILLIYHMPF